MDTLIMYGITSSIPSTVKYKVFGSAGVFEIEFVNNQINIDWLAKSISNNIFTNSQSIEQLLVEQLRLMQADAQRKLRTFLEALSTPEAVSQELSKYLEPGHAREEGRGRKGQHVWLPLYPHIGKYLTKEYRYESKSYGVCPMCVVLAALGFYRAAIPIRLPPPERSSQVLLLTFEGFVNEKQLGELFSFIQNPAFVQDVINNITIRRGARTLPSSTFIYVILASFSSSLLKTLHQSAATWKVLSTTFDVIRGGVVQVRGYEEVVVDRFLSSLIKLIDMDSRKTPQVLPLSRLDRLTRWLIDKEEPAAVEALYRFLVTCRSSDLYVASRQLAKALQQGLGKDFCEELACLVRRA